jgi:hypothetical protein
VENPNASAPPAADTVLIHDLNTHLEIRRPQADTITRRRQSSNKDGRRRIRRRRRHLDGSRSRPIRPSQATPTSSSGAASSEGPAADAPTPRPSTLIECLRFGAAQGRTTHSASLAGPGLRILHPRLASTKRQPGARVLEVGRLGVQRHPRRLRARPDHLRAVPEVRTLHPSHPIPPTPY